MLMVVSIVTHYLFTFSWLLTLICSCGPQVYDTVISLRLYSLIDDPSLSHLLHWDLFFAYTQPIPYNLSRCSLLWCLYCNSYISSSPQPFSEENILWLYARQTSTNFPMDSAFLVVLGQDGAQHMVSPNPPMNIFALYAPAVARKARERCIFLEPTVARGVDRRQS